MTEWTALVLVNYSYAPDSDASRPKRKLSEFVPGWQNLTPCTGSGPLQYDGMTRVTRTVTISLPPEMATELELVRKLEHRTRSELVREALRQYFSRRRDAS